jgi:hypothetical protein
VLSYEVARVRGGVVCCAVRSRARSIARTHLSEVGLLPFYAILVIGRFPGNSDFYPKTAQRAKFTERLTDMTCFGVVSVPNIAVYSVNGSFFRDDAIMVKAASFAYRHCSPRFD